jgi:hypothetical protein
MDSTTRTITHNFTFAGTVDELVNLVRDWRALLPGSLSPGYFPFYDPRTQEQSVNIDLWTTKYLHNRHERLYVGAARAKGIGLGDRAAIVADRGQDLEKLVRTNDPQISQVKRIELLVTLVKYQDVEVPRPNWDNRLDFYTVRAWKLHDDVYPPIIISFDQQEAMVKGWLQFPDVMQPECEQLLNDIAAWTPTAASVQTRVEPTPKPGKIGHPGINAHKRARERLQAGEDERTVRIDWRRDYEEETGEAPDQTTSGENQLWRNVKKPITRRKRR